MQRPVEKKKILNNSCQIDALGNYLVLGETIL